MHPSDEILVGFLASRGEDREGTAAHLAGCRDCAARAARLADAAGILAWARGEGDAQAPSAAAASRAREAWQGAPGSSRRGWRRPLLAAAALLLLASGLLRWMPKTALPSLPVPAAASLGKGRLLLPAPGVECLLAEGSRMAPGTGGVWTLEAGACLVQAPGGEGLRLRAGALEVLVAEGEALLRLLPPGPPGLAALWLTEADAAEGPSAELVLLSGRAEALLAGQRLALAPGEGARADGSGRLERLDVPAARQAALREAVQAGRTDSARGRLLDGRGGRADWLDEPPGTSYQLTVRLRVLERPSVLGLSFPVDSRGGLWVAEPEDLPEGTWHVLRLSVSPGWVCVVLDGAVRHRVARADFRPSAAGGLSGLGPVAWGGRVEIGGLDVEGWD